MKNALIAYLVVQPVLIEQVVTDADSLFKFFLIDVQMSSCLQTSRTKQTISTVQLFVRRCLLCLELDPDKQNQPLLVDPLRWSWMSTYRVWEANRRRVYRQLGTTCKAPLCHSAIWPKRTKRISHPVRFISGDLIWQIVTLPVLSRLLGRSLALMCLITLLSRLPAWSQSAETVSRQPRQYPRMSCTGRPRISPRMPCQVWIHLYSFLVSLPHLLPESKICPLMYWVMLLIQAAL